MTCFPRRQRAAIIERLIVKSGVVADVEARMGRTAEGRIIGLSSYSVRLLMGGWIWLAATGAQLTLRNLLRLLWTELPASTLAKLDPDHRLDLSKREIMFDEDRPEFDAEYKLLQMAWQRVKSTWDWSEHTAAEISPEDREKRRVWAHDLMHRMLYKTLPPRPAEYLGGLATDHTQVDAWNAKSNSDNDPDGAWCPNRDNIFRVRYNLTVTVPIHNVYGPLVGAYATGFALSSGTTNTAAVILESVDRHIAAGWGPHPEESKQPRADAVFDAGISYLDNLAAELLDRRYEQVQEYPNSFKDLRHRLLRTMTHRQHAKLAGQPPPEDPDLARTRAVFDTGAELAYGTLLAPCVGNLLEAVPPYPGSKGSDADWIDYFQAVDALTRHQLRIHKRPERLTQPQPGRPPKTAGPRPKLDKWSVITTCPAMNGEVRCPHAPATMSDPDLAHLPMAHEPPDARMPVCNNFATLHLDPIHIKQWQADPLWSRRGFDRYKGARTKNEGYFAFLERKSMGNLRYGNWELTGFANNIWFAAVAMSLTNMILSKGTERRRRRSARRAGQPANGYIPAQRRDNRHYKRAKQHLRLKRLPGIPKGFLTAFPEDR